MKTQNYLTTGLMTMLLIAILSTSGCVGEQPQIPPTTTGGGDTGGGTGTGTGQVSGGGTSGGGLPLTDITTGTEPIARYPGSIMVLHSKFTSPEQGSAIQISYATTASTDTVEAWYKDMLAGSGWELVMEYEEADTKSISYSKEDPQAMVTISLSSDAGETGIGITYVGEE